MSTDSTRVDLALQGGGAHGAFTWGVLDRLLEEENLFIEGVSGTSAGAMNAALMACGLARGCRAEARRLLREFWRKIADAATFSPLQRTPVERLFGDWTLEYSPAFLWLDMTSRLISPYTLGGLAQNPLRKILCELIDFDCLAGAPLKLFVTATNVESGQARIFRSDEISVDVLLASACLPTLYQAIEIDGVPYWDGGYSGNPTLTPLVRECESNDTILVQINPVMRQGTPRSASDIANRVNEIAFNAPLLKELRMMALLHQVTDPGNTEARAWKAMRLHRISTEKMVELGHASKLVAEWDFLEMLFRTGRDSAQAFLSTDGPNLGVRSSLDLTQLID
jgi:NTE family protein